MQHHIGERIYELIDRHDLHGTYDDPIDYVSLAPLELVFPVRRLNLSTWGIDGFVIPPGGELSEDNCAVITLHTGLLPFHFRLAYAHEIGHALYGHEGAFRMADIEQWFTDRAEREAWTVAAQLLIPIDTMTRYQERAQIAGVCQVPEWMLDLV